MLDVRAKKAVGKTYKKDSKVPMMAFIADAGIEAIKKSRPFHIEGIVSRRGRFLGRHEPGARYSRYWLASARSAFIALPDGDKLWATSSRASARTRHSSTRPPSAGSTTRLHGPR